ncbi:MerR family DNA-binding transcriptional regulator [Scytonema sp. HK-05]|uniref:MerR family DNA-binding transcriptional regulator n=1 Tax=Scytonema sp. HK-05 TaxID=1137095 RepID=UPI0009365EE4|nr:hypothetical protein NIES2130_33405 [Scytonema sp. HK-05]
MHALVGVSTSTLRPWESENRVIPERTLGNQRVYTEKHNRASEEFERRKRCCECSYLLPSFV